ncbi:MAG: NUDIX hydrolase [Halieaceae bacterium]
MTRDTSKANLLKQSVLTVFYSAWLGGCSLPDSPPCPFTNAQDSAPSAGCFLLVDNKLLVVQGLAGYISPPGGSSDPGESAQCTAFRETWEETGLRLRPREKIATFDTGFILYRCERDESSGEIDPPPRIEVRQAFYLAADEFDAWQWRYPGQARILLGLMQQADPAHAGSTSYPAQSGKR